MNRNLITLFAFVTALTPVFASASCVSFNRNLHLGMRGGDVMQAQVMLNADPSTQVSLSGPGSPGSETSYFGPSMQQAMKKFQSKHTVEIYGTTHATPTGRAGANTLGLLLKLSCSKIDSGASTTTTQSAPVTASGTSGDRDANIIDPLVRSSSPAVIHVGEIMTVNGLNLSNVRTILLDSQGGTVSHHYTFPSSIIASNNGKVLMLKMPEVAVGDYRLTLGLANPTYAYRYKYTAFNIHVVGGVATATASKACKDPAPFECVPFLRSITPEIITSGDTITLHGDNFGNIASSAIHFMSTTGDRYSYTYPNSVSGMVLSANDNTIVLRTPQVEAGTYAVAIQVYTGKYPYEYQPAAVNVTVRDKAKACAVSVSPTVISSGDTFVLDIGNCPNLAKFSDIHFDAASGTPAFLYAYPNVMFTTPVSDSVVLKVFNNTFTLRAPKVKPGVYQVSYKSDPDALSNPARIWSSSAKITVIDKVSSAPVMNSEEDYALKCADHTYPAIYSICQPKDQRLAYLKAQFAKATKPMTQAYVNSFGPGFENSSQAFADWTYIHKGPTVYSCDDAVSIFGLFGGNRQTLGNWKVGSNRDFYSDGKYIGSGGVAVSETQWVDKNGLPMVEKSSNYDAVGYCQHN